MQRIQRALFWTIMLSETMHVFCCVLPIVVSILSLLAGMGLMSVLPTGLMGFHEFMHDYEWPLITTSGIILALGWGLQVLSRGLDCHNTGCEHGPCSSKKVKSFVVLKVATVLFLVNTSVYLFIHAG